MLNLKYSCYAFVIRLFLIMISKNKIELNDELLHTNNGCE